MREGIWTSILPNYVKKALFDFVYEPEVSPQYYPHEYISTQWIKK